MHMLQKNLRSKHKRILKLNRTSGKKLLEESVNKRIRNSI